MSKQAILQKKVLSITSQLSQSLSMVNDELISFIEDNNNKIKLELLEEISKNYNIDINELKKKYLKTKKSSKKTEKVQQNIVDDIDINDNDEPIYKEFKSLTESLHFYYVYNKRFGSVINTNKEIVGYTSKGSDILILLDNTVIVIKDTKNQIYEKGKYENGNIKLNNGNILNIDESFKKYLEKINRV